MNNKITDDLEKDVAKILDEKNIKYYHDSERENVKRLDFYLPDFDVYIEIKQFHAGEREFKQWQRHDNTIFITGKKSIQFLKTLLLSK